MNFDLELKYGLLVRVSMQGARGFYYPSEETIPIHTTCTGVLMPGWQRYRGYSAYKIPSSAVLKKYRYDEESKYMIVWCETPDQGGA